VKIRAVWFVAAFVMTLPCHTSSVQASSLGDLLGFKPGPDRTYSHNVTNSSKVANSGQSQYPGAAQYQSPAYPVAPAKRTQSMDARNQVSPRLAYQRPISQTRSNTPHGNSSIRGSKSKASQTAGSKGSLQSMMTLPSNQHVNGRVAHSYQPIYPAQPGNASLQGYRQPPGAVRYTNPYQSQYTPVRNYYQGYSYNTWNSGSSAQTCAPGRA
jgi:hypothetical protein